MDSDEADAHFKEPTMRFETVPHRGAINRLRTMHGSPIVATWNEDGEVGIYNVAQAMEELEKPISSKKKFGACKVAGFKHKYDGWALDWSPSTYGRLASGSNDAQIHLYQAADENCSTFVEETPIGLQGHKGSIEDL
jgi:WD40 repeat protein